MKIDDKPAEFQVGYLMQLVDTFIWSAEKGWLPSDETVRTAKEAIRSLKNKEEAAQC